MTTQVESREFTDKRPSYIDKKKTQRSIWSPPICNGVEISMSVWVLCLSLFSFIVVESIFILLGIHYGDNVFTDGITNLILVIYGIVFLAALCSHNRKLYAA